MNTHPKKFYSDFQIFLREVTREMIVQKTLSANWLQGIRDTMGASSLYAILTVATKIPIIGSIISSASPSLTVGATLHQKTAEIIQEFENDNAWRTKINENERIEKARLLYNEFLTMSNEVNRRQAIDELFEDLVNGNEILY
jgi:hypothetical protein